MSNSTISSIKAELEGARAVRSEIVASMSDAYDPEAFSKLQNQSQLVSQLAASLAAAEKAEADEAAKLASPQLHASTGDDGTAIVALLSGGKKDKTLQVRAGLTLGAVLREIGWSVEESYTFRRRIGVGQSVLLMNPMDYVLTAGSHEISMLPASEGGL